VVPCEVQSGDGATAYGRSGHTSVGTR